MMLPMLSGLLFALWFLLSVWLLAPDSARLPLPGNNNLKVDLTSGLRLEGLRAQAKAKGGQLSPKELQGVVLISLLVSAGLALLLENPLLVIIGLVAGLYLPKFIIEKKRRHNRYRLIKKLTDPMHLLLSRLPDQQNITKAMEQTRDELQDSQVRKLFEGYLKDVAIGGSVQEALLNLQKKVSLRKYDNLLEYLIQAHYEGFTAEALQALNKALEAIEFDLRAIEKVKEKSRAKKKELYISLGIAWMFPFVLSMANTGEHNIYLETIAGKVLMLFYIAGSLYVLLKGEEYLSLNLDEL